VRARRSSRQRAGIAAVAAASTNVPQPAALSSAILGAMAGAHALKPYVSYAEYLELEEKSLTKHEWLDGVVYDMEALGMAGGTPDHAGLAATVTTLLGQQVRGKLCRAFSSDLKVRVLATGLSTYPDISVVCGKLETAPDDPNAVINPTLLVEVLSDPSEAYDRGEKFAHYRRIPSLREYVLVSQRKRQIEVWRKNERGRWELGQEAGAGEDAELASIHCSLPVNEVYADPLAGSG
jgi:Uma2 family endonuclease